MSSRITRFLDAREEPVYRHLLPIDAYQHAPLVSLDEALKPVAQFFNAIEKKAWVAKENCKQSKEGLEQDESASIHLYTMQFSEGLSLFEVLNRTLRALDREGLKPWFKFLKIFMTALYKLPSYSETVWRGVPAIDLSSKYPPGKKFTWWGVSSCTTDMKVLEAAHFLGKTGNRTLFSIECKNGKSVALHSYFENKEEEIILMPGSYFEVKTLASLAEGLHYIHLKEIDPPFPMIEPPFNVNEASGTISQLQPIISSSTTSSSDRLKTKEDVGEWLKSLGKEYTVYVSNFDEKSVDGYWLLNQLNDESLFDYGVKDKKHRQKILKEIEVLKKKVSTETSKKKN